MLNDLQKQFYNQDDYVEVHYDYSKSALKERIEQLIQTRDYLSSIIEDYNRFLSQGDSILDGGMRE